MTGRRSKLLIIALIPVLLLTMVVIHEEGHTLLARFFGDANSTFTLVEIKRTSFCLGCNVYDHTKLPFMGNVLVSLGGLLFTQVVAILAVMLARVTRDGSFPRRLLKTVIVIFAFLDVPVQVLHALAMDLTHETFPTNTDLTDFMLLISTATGTSPATLKVLLIAVSGVYLFVIYRLSLRKRIAQMQ